MLDPLSRLATIHGTDKFGYHDYTPIYHAALNRPRDDALKVLEIGVGGYADEHRGGHSLAMWRDYFPNAEITAFDIHKKTLDLGPRVRIYQGSQVDAAFLADLVDARGPFDIIIDDGSHFNEHVVDSFGILWPTLTPGGFYVAEDLQTAFVERRGGSLELTAPNSVGLFGQMMLPQPGQPLADAAGFATMVRVHNVVILQKAGKGVPGTPSELAAHFGFDAPVDLPKGQDWREAFEELPPQGTLALRDIGALNDPERADLYRRFAEIDHVEIATQFPDAPADPVARDLFAMMRHGDDLLLCKRPNDYPSNFAFDPDHPRVATALRQMGEVLQEEPTAQGIISYIRLLRHYRTPDELRSWIGRIDDLDDHSREGLKLRINLAQTTANAETTERLLTMAIALFPQDTGFSRDMAAFLLKEDRPEEANELVAKIRARGKLDLAFEELRARIASRLGDTEAAVAAARASVALSAEPKKPMALIRLARHLMKADALDQAEHALREAIDRTDSTFSPAFRHLSTVHLARGDTDAALNAIDTAIALSPESTEYIAWRNRVMTKATSS